MSLLGGTINNSEISKSSFLQTYKPAITSGTGVGGILSSATGGQYLQLGKLVYVRGFVITGAIVGGATVMNVNLPFRVDSSLASGLSGSTPGFINTYLTGCVAGGKQIYWTIKDNSNIMFPTAADGTNPLAVGSVYTFSGWYFKK